MINTLKGGRWGRWMVQEIRNQRTKETGVQSSIRKRSIDGIITSNLTSPNVIFVTRQVLCEAK